MAHVLFISDEYPLNKRERGQALRQLAQGLAASGYQTGVISPHINTFKSIFNPHLIMKTGRASSHIDERVPVYQIEGINIFPVKHFSSTLFQRYLGFLLKKYFFLHGKPDLVHIHHFLWSEAAAKYWCKHYNLSYLISYYPDKNNQISHNNSDDSGSGINIVPHPVFKRDALSRATVIYTPVERQYRYNPAWSVSHKLIYLPGHRFADSLCSGIEQSMDKDTDIQIIVDAGKAKKNLIDSFEDKSKANRITAFPETTEILRMANIVVCWVKKYEDLEIVKQAQLAGKILICNDSIWTRPIIHSGNGILIHQHHKTEIAQAVEQIINHSDLFNFSKISQNALHLFGESENIKSILSKYRKAISRDAEHIKTSPKPML